MMKWLILISLMILLIILRKGLVPLMIGLVLAYILDPYVGWLEKKLKLGRLLCIALAYITFFSATILLILGFADILSGKLTSQSLQDAISALRDYYLQHKDVLDEQLHISFDGAAMTKLLQNIGSGTIKLFIGAIIGVYLLKDKAYFLRLGSKTLHLLLGQKLHGIVRELFFEINEVISAFFRGVFIDSVIVAFLSSLALAILQVDFAIFIGCFAGIANIIPYFGPILGMIPAAVAALADGGIPKAIFAAGSLFIIQQVECNLIYPRIIGKSTGLHPLFVLITVSLAGYYGGLISMVLAVPLAGILRVLVCKWAYTQ